ncbi:MAG: hypothetical protein JWR67_2163 [Mucilaginibacter sp.]|nr:hypothetical protein [Mucilaginibacter sp.]
MKNLKVLAIALLATFSVTAVSAQMGERHVVVVKHNRHIVKHRIMLHHPKK